MRVNVERGSAEEKETEGGRERERERNRDFMRLGANVKYFNHRLSCYENAFDPDSKGLFTKQAFL